MIVNLKSLLGVEKKIEIDALCLQALKKSIVAAYYVQAGRHQYKSFDSAQVVLLYQGKKIDSNDALGDTLLMDPYAVFNFIIPIAVMEQFKRALAEKYYKVLCSWSKLSSPNKGQVTVLSNSILHTLNLGHHYQDEGELVILQDLLLNRFESLEKSLLLSEALQLRMSPGEQMWAKIKLATFLGQQKRHDTVHVQTAEDLFEAMPPLVRHATDEEKKTYALARKTYAELLYNKSLNYTDDERDALLQKAMAVALEVEEPSLESQILNLRDLIFHRFTKEQAMEEQKDSPEESRPQEKIIIKNDCATLWRFADKVRQAEREKFILQQEKKQLEQSKKQLEQENALLKQKIWTDEAKQGKKTEEPDPPPSEQGTSHPIRIQRPLSLPGFSGKRNQFGGMGGLYFHPIIPVTHKVIGVADVESIENKKIQTQPRAIPNSKKKKDPPVSSRYYFSEESPFGVSDSCLLEDAVGGGLSHSF